jgi:hypothetical protein
MLLVDTYSFSTILLKSWCSNAVNIVSKLNSPRRDPIILNTSNIVVGLNKFCTKIKFDEDRPLTCSLRLARWSVVKKILLIMAKFFRTILHYYQAIVFILVIFF